VASEVETGHPQVDTFTPRFRRRATVVLL